MLLGGQGIVCVWEYQKPLPPRTGSVTFFWKTDPNLDTPDIQTCQAEVPLAAAEMLARDNAPAGPWSIFAGLLRPTSRGRIQLTAPTPPNVAQLATQSI